MTLQSSATRHLPPWEGGDLASRPVTGTVKNLATELFQRICAERYSYGTRLPAERHLAEEFGVSRNTIRQALDLLEDFEVVSRRAGSGSFVSFKPRPEARKSNGPETGEELPPLEEIAEITSPLELNVVRTIIEPEMVRLAVINMSARDIAKLHGVLATLESITTDAAEFARWDEIFHLQLARGTHNPLLIAMYELINHVRRQAHWAPNKEKNLSPRRIRDYQQKHRSIYEAIEARDIESAVEFVKLHMTDVQQDLTRGS